ncbi:MAG: hypothetical protein RSD35_07640 [Oscillospiraceae bacterium]
MKPLCELRFGLEEVTGELLAYPSSDLHVVVWRDGAWSVYDGIFGDWLDSTPITESEAMRLTSGVMPT